MVVTLSGITGVGKSYLKRCAVEQLNFRNIIIITTRKKRLFEKNGKDKWFVDEKTFNELEKKKEIVGTFEFLGNKYGYYAKDLQDTSSIGITELHYTEIDNFKKACKDTISIYVKPVDVNIAKKKLLKRKLPEETTKKRIKEIEEQVLNYENNLEIQEKFDYVFINNYTRFSKKQFVNFLNNRIGGFKKKRKAYERGK